MSAEEVRRHLYTAEDLWSTDVHAVISCGEGEPRFRLGYMPMRNRCEVPRLILEEAQCPYKFEVLGFRKWKAGLKAEMPLGKCPVLYNFDGKGNHLAQETAITRFLAGQVGLDGHSAEERAMLDMMYQQLWCTIRNNGLTHDGEHYSAVALAGLEGRPEGPSYQEMPRVNDFTVAQRSLAALDVFEAWLERSGTGFLVGDTPMYVDLGLFETLFELAEPEHVPDFAERFGLPRLGAFLEAMSARPQLKRYLESPGRMPRYTRPGYVYCSGRSAPEPAAA